MNEENKIIDGVNFVMRDADDTNDSLRETYENDQFTVEHEIKRQNDEQQIEHSLNQSVEQYADYVLDHNATSNVEQFSEQHSDKRAQRAEQTAAQRAEQTAEQRVEDSTESQRAEQRVEYSTESSTMPRYEYNNEESSQNEMHVDSKKASNKKNHGKKKHPIVRKVTALVTSAAVFGVVAGLAFQGVQQGNNGTNSVTPTVSVESNADSISVDSLSTSNNGGKISTDSTGTAVTDVSGVVANVMPAIVAINSTVTQTTYDFFGREYNQEGTGSGSGIIIAQTESDLLIATNNHVVEGANTIEIVFDDKSKASATVKGTEPSSDLAVVAVKLSDLTKETKEYIRVATLGDSDEVKIGEMSIAIGNALGYGQSVTVGYISALNREVTVDDITLNLLQTDAAINPGNSGGALLNASGEIIGINSVKYTDTSVEGIGYAIPISTAIPIINDLMNREVLEEGESGYLGIMYKPYSDSFRETFSMPEGVYIYSVNEGSPAEAAGLHQGDIITSIGGRPIKDYDELKSYLSYTRAGTSVELVVKYLDNGKYVEKTVEVKLSNRPTE